ncbi:hypothetical protein HAX54_001881 [Datura stramonium]|uniref:Uncharacterized protein n=1 Tax=Datura stramonium TaxID=4076 RepID=A0ABS8WQY5_DATST|nr:hypothetical protein [Datura stramonium]
MSSEINRVEREEFGGCANKGGLERQRRQELFMVVENGEFWRGVRGRGRRIWMVLGLVYGVFRSKSSTGGGENDRRSDGCCCSSRRSSGGRKMEGAGCQRGDERERGGWWNRSLPEMETGEERERCIVWSCCCSRVREEEGVVAVTAVAGSGEKREKGGGATIAGSGEGREKREVGSWLGEGGAGGVVFWSELMEIMVVAGGLFSFPAGNNGGRELGGGRLVGRRGRRRLEEGMR